ncbi:tetratricopeptide repeat protein [Seonamhaeicola marinus]|uniref:Tetratricopeptide repeat protein n=1 Tax=Seonamhaeicola marinus TaxID=1912246 RepID=A0A5D0IKX2_9FLAO|nr:tetratricopeptide repeat protein [Seonamhaeicola marinus]TYA84214.1 tetratricopeptide repeat protein [Seonamhaeicola marinus]
MKSVLGIITFFAFFVMHGQKPYDTNRFIDKSNLHTTKKLDSAVYYLNKGVTYYREQKDTINLINTLCHLSSLYDNVLDYGKSYDGYWDALILADLSKDEVSKARVYQELGWLYNSYRREEESLRYFNLSLKLKKKLLEEGKINRGYLISNYFAIVNCYRVNNDLRMSKVYLDSCEIHRNKIEPKQKSFYVESEKAYYKAAVGGNYKDAHFMLNEAKTFFQEADPSYLTVIYYLIAEVYRMENKFDQAIKYYKESLKFSEIYNRHLGYKQFNYEILSDLYYKKANYKEAFYFKEKGQELNEKIFGRSSRNNKHLIEIKDKFRLQKEKEKTLLKEARIEKLENQKRIAFLQNILMGVVVVFLLLYGILFVRNLRRKHKLEKEKTNEVMALKNRELTASALQLIEKEEFIVKLKESITKKNGVDVNAINRMISSFQNAPGGNWDEFDARFTSINQSFYNNIRKKYPKLGPTDLKMCALIKLGFSCKEMSSLMGITIESVHTSRYRLRKKLGIDKGTNLVDFMSAF